MAKTLFISKNIIKNNPFHKNFEMFFLPSILTKPSERGHERIGRLDGYERRGEIEYEEGQPAGDETTDDDCQGAGCLRLARHPVDTAVLMASQCARAHDLAATGAARHRRRRRSGRRLGCIGYGERHGRRGLVGRVVWAYLARRALGYRGGGEPRAQDRPGRGLHWRLRVVRCLWYKFIC